MRVPGLGRVFDRPKGSGKNWAIAYYLDGAEQRESVADLTGQRPTEITEDEAIRCLKRRVREVATGGADPRTKHVRVADVLEHYLAKKHLDEIWSMDGSCRWLDQELGAIRVREITGRWLTAWLLGCKQRGLRLNTLTTRYRALKAALRLAAVDGLIWGVPAFPRFAVDYVRKGFFEAEQAERVIAELHEPLNDIARWGYNTGWRKEEILGLEWAWIDRAAHLVTLPGHESKNDDPRVVPYGDHPELVAVIARRWARRALGCPFVFHRLGGTPIRSFDAAWRSACERAGLAGRHFHDFRRTVLRDTVAGGADLRTAMALTGHRSLKVADRYNIVDAKMARRAVSHLTAYRDQARHRPGRQATAT